MENVDVFSAIDNKDSQNYSFSMHFIGPHVSIRENISLSPERAHELGATGFAIFTKNQRIWSAPPLKDEDAVKDILKDAGYEVGDDHQVVVLGAGDFQTVDMYGKPIEQDISEGVGLNFGLGYHYKDGFSENNWENVKDIKDGDTIYVLHQKDDGTWEVLEGKAVVEDTEYYTRVSVEVNLTSLSPVAFIKVMSDGEVVVLDKNETPVQKVDTKTAKTTTVTVKKSPKTGE